MQNRIDDKAYMITQIWRYFAEDKRVKGNENYKSENNVTMPKHVD